MALRRIGKYYGENELLPDLMVAETIDVDYEDVTDLCMIMSLESELGWTHQDCLTYANEYIAEIGVENLKPHELNYYEVNLN